MARAATRSPWHTSRTRSLTKSQTRSLHTNVLGSAPVALGGHGDVVVPFNRVDFFFLAANLNWKF